MTLIRELIDLPEVITRGDFVLKLSEGITNPEQTLRDYVVTPQLVLCFENALSLIKGALEGQVSKGAYLHGSFGSGKSHFMAVLHLLLAGNSIARSLPELRQVVTKHAAWMEGKKFLLVPLHMIGAPSLEAALLGGYAAQVRKLHPTAPLPGLYLADGIFRDANGLRARMGDPAFFTVLNERSQPSAGGWGALEGQWEPASFEAAVAAPSRDPNRTRLVALLVEKFFTSLATAAANNEGFVGIDDGLAIASAHARSLGYDALILFLDELVLWLASHAADQKFIGEEGPKVAKLVEAQAADRPAPIVSFVARQRNLADLVGETFTGAEKLHFTDCLAWWEARFAIITLEDRNLPAIAEKRVLRPKSEAARQEIDGAFRETDAIRREVMDILLTSQGNRDQFRQVYPFSPALVETLVAISSLLQRERTALKVMLQLLVNQRETLELGQVVPVGDLFDVIAEGDEPFTDVMRTHFENSRKLYEEKLRPLIQNKAGLTFEDAAIRPPSDPQVRGLRMADRLAKTLLLSGLAPNVESLRDLTPVKLAALNHGTIRSPIPGTEGQVVLNYCRDWAASIGQIKLTGDQANPMVSIQLSGVDTGPILARAAAVDNSGNRQQKVRELVFGQLKVQEQGRFDYSREHIWRGSKRLFDIVFANVREMSDEALKSQDGTWKIVIDFPFDEVPHGPQDDLSRLESFSQDYQEGTRTIAWIPSFLNLASQADLGLLVKLDYILAGDRFNGMAAEFSVVDRHTARLILESQRDQLRHKLLRVLEGAYGTATPTPNSLDPTHHPFQHFCSLEPGFRVQAAVGLDLGRAFEQLLDQALEYQFPGHPDFSPDPRPTINNLKKIHLEVQRALGAEGHRIAIDRPLREVMAKIAVPLRLGEMGETHFVLGHYWTDHVLRKLAQEPAGTLTVHQLRRFMDDPQPRGLAPEVGNLVIVCFAEQTGRTFRRFGAPFPPSLENLPNDAELQEQPLPEPEIWELAFQRAASIFGVSVPRTLSAGTLQNLASEVGKIASLDFHGAEIG